jgi:hypothetical protein
LIALCSRKLTAIGLEIVRETAWLIGAETGGDR